MAGLASYRFHHLRLPYQWPIRWGGHEENAADVVLLEVRDADGRATVAELPVRPAWHRIDVNGLVTQLSGVLGDAVEHGRDLESCLAFAGLNPVARALIDIAAWQLRASVAGQPLWQALGGTRPSVPLSWTITREAPAVMARKAARAVDLYGIRAFKIKTGQGFDTDRKALGEIRGAVGDEARLFVDSNGHGAPEDVGRMSRMLVEHGVLVFEDPCRLTPGPEFAALRAQCGVPILVDDGCRSYENAERFCAAGAEALSIKTMKTGLSESLAIARMAMANKAKLSVGLTAASSFGALSTLALATAVPEAFMSGPCEESFFAVAAEYLAAPLCIKDGSVELPATTDYTALIDWDKAKSFIVA